jgi:hypothetical protein
LNIKRQGTDTPIRLPCSLFFQLIEIVRHLLDLVIRDPACGIRFLLNQLADRFGFSLNHNFHDFTDAGQCRIRLGARSAEQLDFPLRPDPAEQECWGRELSADLP